MDEPEAPAQNPRTEDSGLVGRTLELAELSQALERAIAGQGSSVLISGEAGIGKTSLVQELLVDARRQGARTLAGGAYDLTATPPYGPWFELLESARSAIFAPEPPAKLIATPDSSPDRQKTEVFQHFLQYFQELSAITPLVIVIEDLHWADQASLDLLRYLCRQIEDYSILMVGTYRDDEIDRNHPLFYRLPLLIRESRVIRIELNALNRSEVHELTRHFEPMSERQKQQLVSFLLAYTDGIPLLTIELIRTLEREGHLILADGTWAFSGAPNTPVPALIHQAVELRLSTIPEFARTAIETAAIVGHSVSLDIWEALVGTDVALEAAEHAIQAQLMTTSDDGKSLSFRHALLREAIHTSISLVRRRRDHRNLADLLIKRQPKKIDTIAYHLSEAGDSRTRDWLIRAGLQARQSGAWFNAAEMFERAAKFVNHDQNQTRDCGWLLFYAAFLLRYTHDSRNFNLLHDALEVANESGDEFLRACIHYHRGAAMAMRGEIRAGVQELEHGVSELEQLPGDQLAHSTEERMRATVVNMISERWDIPETQLNRISGVSVPKTSFQRGVFVNWLSQNGQYSRSIGEAESYCSAIEHVVSEDSSRSGNYLSGRLGLAHALVAYGDIEQATRIYESVIDGFTTIGDYHMAEYACWQRLFLVTIPFETDSIEQRRRIVALGTEAASRSTSISGEIDISWSAALDDFLQGNWSALQTEFERLWSGALGAVWRYNVGLTLSRIHYYRGECDEARYYIDKLLPDGADTGPENHYFACAVELHPIAADLALVEQNPDLARDWLQNRDRWIKWSGASRWDASSQLHWAEFYFKTANQGEAFQHAYRAMALASDPRQPLTLLKTHRLIGQMCAQKGDRDGAVNHFSISQSLADACAIPVEQGLTLLSRAEFELNHGQPAAVNELLSTARRSLEPPGATPTLNRIDELARQTGARRGNTSCILSRREGEVLHLLSEGKSDKDIADELFISRHTVMNHVSSILRKLDVESRTAAAAKAFRQEMI